MSCIYSRAPACVNATYVTAFSCAVRRTDRGPDHQIRQHSLACPAGVVEMAPPGRARRSDAERLGKSVPRR